MKEGIAVVDSYYKHILSLGIATYIDYMPYINHIYLHTVKVTVHGNKPIKKYIQRHQFLWALKSFTSFRHPSQRSFQPQEAADTVND